MKRARAYSVLRKQFDGRPIASHQLVQEKLADMITEITKAQLLALQVGRLKDRGQADAAHISMLKRNNVAIALDCARASRDLLGANGIIDEYPDHAPYVQPRNRQDLRRHRSYSRPGNRRARHRHRRL